MLGISDTVRLNTKAAGQAQEPEFRNTANCGGCEGRVRPTPAPIDHKHSTEWETAGLAAQERGTSQHRILAERLWAEAARVLRNNGFAVDQN